SDSNIRGLRNVESGDEVADVGSVLLERRRALAVKEAAGPRQLLAHRPRPHRRRQRNAEGPLERGAFDRTEPWSDPFDYLKQIRSRGGFPVVERLPALNDDRAFDAPYADDPLELDEHVGNPVRASLVDPRLDATAAPVGPALAVEESCGPGKVVALQPRDLDRTRRACLSPKRAKTSSKCAKAVAQMCGRSEKARGRASRPASLIA